MKNKITPDPISMTTHHLHMGFTQTDTVVSSGTGFIYEHNSNFYMITNWHNVSGKHPSTTENLSDKAAMPDIISTLFRDKDEPANCKREHIQIYNDKDMLKPKWLVHPEYGETVDVVAILIEKEIQDKYRLFPINKIEFDDEIKLEVADDVFVIGYPFSEITYIQLPIWKKGSIASEPDVNINQTPKLLIDTATRPGLSGSPVIMQRIGVHGLENGKFKPDSIIGRIRKFIGIYSGRIGDDESKAQLGIVWKARVINEILDGGVIGNNLIE